MSADSEVFNSEDFDDYCEDCGAPPGALCYLNCPSGYSNETREKHLEQIRSRKRDANGTSNSDRTSNDGELNG